MDLVETFAAIDAMPLVPELPTEGKPNRLTLVRWGITVNARGPLGSRIVGAYVRESLRRYDERIALERAFDPTYVA